MRYHWNLLLLALSFFTRIPVAQWCRYSPELLKKSYCYFSIVGWILALLLAAIYLPLSYLFPPEVSAFLLLVVALLLTGVFHQDGLADMLDGFGGGLNRERKLDIMKDSRLGTYGVSGLTLMLLGNWLCWVNLAQEQKLIQALWIAYPLSRGVAASFIYDLSYVAAEANSKSVHLAQTQSQPALLFCLAVGSIGLFTLPWQQATVILCVITVVRALLKRLFKQQIGGYTGDCLGAAQQLFELTIYLSLVAFYHAPTTFITLTQTVSTNTA